MNEDDRSRPRSPAEPYAGVFRPPWADDLEAERTEERTREADDEAARADDLEGGTDERAADERAADARAAEERAAEERAAERAGRRRPR